ncbi:uncharacterized protein LOC114257205 [Camellia sinensis]|uniref:uncharacterized protein LOC114257205 n=1 Tax=Camellia sinensis TaxID=4442 RepID=UPI001035B6CB|nr:uncharacterized protein LOC114257205 [Camellia sinensis]
MPFISEEERENGDDNFGCYNGGNRSRYQSQRRWSSSAPIFREKMGSDFRVHVSDREEEGDGGHRRRGGNIGVREKRKAVAETVNNEKCFKIQDLLYLLATGPYIC